MVLDAFFDQPAAPVTVLVPSYQEDERVIRTTLLSAALQEYPALRVVLLIDDPQHPTTRTRQGPAGRRAGPARDHRDRAGGARQPLPHRPGRLRARRPARAPAALRRPRTCATSPATTGSPSSGWTTWRPGTRSSTTPTLFFVDHVLGALAADLATVGEALARGAAEEGDRAAGRSGCCSSTAGSSRPSAPRVTSFERKRYRSLSHEPNKAMNLNSYIGLMGGSVPGGRDPAGPGARAGPRPVRPTWSSPTPTTCSPSTPTACCCRSTALRLVHLLEQSAHAGVAVAQTPYSSFPGSATRLERISGATTDLQHIVHQGMTHYDATFWVGANAVLRKKALDDIVEIDYDGDFEIRRYIQDRTVIEDTESTIDLGVHGWTLVNYPERLTYSRHAAGLRLAVHPAPALGQRRPADPVQAARADRGPAGRAASATASASCSCGSTTWRRSSGARSACVIMLVYPFNAELLNPMLLLVSVPYFLVMAGGPAGHCGYRRTRRAAHLRLQPDPAAGQPVGLASPRCCS